jgi:heme exporter protein C
MKLGKPTMPPEMYIPMLAMFLGFTLLFGALLLTRLRAEVLNRERTASWIRDVVGA